MKSDARLLLNKKKLSQRIGSTNQSIRRTQSGTIDARKILNQKRSRNAPSLGRFMTNKSATSLIASQIRKEIVPVTKKEQPAIFLKNFQVVRRAVPAKSIKLEEDGNIVITSKSKIPSQVSGTGTITVPKIKVNTSSRNAVIDQNIRQIQPTADMDDLECTTVEDILDFNTLPPAFAVSKPLQNLSRKSAVSHILEKKHTMVADQLAETSATRAAKVFVSNLHPTVTKEDIMELFGDIGLIRDVQMVRAGTAVIDFFDETDAEKACDLYHNRLLDGQPMKCYLQCGDKKQRCTISQRLGERITTNASSSGLSSRSVVSANSRSRYNPNNVQFTVKL